MLGGCAAREKSKKTHIFNPRAVSDFVDIKINYSDGDKEFFRLYYNHDEGKYLYGYSQDYKNDSLFTLIEAYLRNPSSS